MLPSGPDNIYGRALIAVPDTADRVTRAGGIRTGLRHVCVFERAWLIIERIDPFPKALSFTFMTLLAVLLLPNYMRGPSTTAYNIYIYERVLLPM